jgi:hypothetical protein
VLLAKLTPYDYLYGEILWQRISNTASLVPDGVFIAVRNSFPGLTIKQKRQENPLKWGWTTMRRSNERTSVSPIVLKENNGYEE